MLRQSVCYPNLSPLMRNHSNAAQRELERFKTEINLVHFAHSKGFAIDARESFRNGTVMRRGTEKICVSRDSDQHWIFCDSRTGKGGSIIDFTQNLSGASLGYVRRELRGWGREVPKNQNMRLYEAPRPMSRGGSQEILAQVLKMGVHNAHPYLREHRRIPSEVLNNQLFQNTVRIDELGNCIFCHTNQDGITGFEIYNVRFRGFSKGGRKSLWRSNNVSPIERIIFTESPIDAMSHFALKKPQNALYVATSGALSREGVALVEALISHVKGLVECVLATDSDAAGEKHAETLENLIAQVPDAPICRREKAIQKDWNDDLRHQCEIP